MEPLGTRDTKGFSRLSPMTNMALMKKTEGRAGDLRMSPQDAVLGVHNQITRATATTPQDEGSSTHTTWEGGNHTQSLLLYETKAIATGKGGSCCPTAQVV